MGVRGGHGGEVCVYPVCNRGKRAHHPGDLYVLPPPAHVCSSPAQLPSIVFLPNHSLANCLLISFLGFFSLMCFRLRLCLLPTFSPLLFGSSATAPSSDWAAPLFPPLCLCTSKPSPDTLVCAENQKALLSLVCFRFLPQHQTQAVL